MRAIVVLWALTAQSGAVASDAIYRCVGNAGEVYFTDRTCPEGQPEPLTPMNVVAMPSLDRDAMARVEQIDRQVAARDRAAAQERAAAQRADARYAAARVRGCASARAGLERVQRIKRRGYAASSAADLQARERKYALQADRNCS